MYSHDTKKKKTKKSAAFAIRQIRAPFFIEFVTALHYSDDNHKFKCIELQCT